MTTLGQMFGRMVSLARRVEASADDLVREVGRQVVTQAVRSTPYDEGWAKSNWQAGSGSAPQGTRLPFAFKGGPGANDAGAIADAVRIISGHPGNGVPLYISNTAKHIGRLNDGYSRQAPAGFVQLSVQAGLAAVRTRRFLR